MPLIMKLSNWQFEVKPEQKERLDALRQKYEGKLFQNRQELSEAYRSLDDELFEISGHKMTKYDFKYGPHGMNAVMGFIKSLKSAAATPEEKDKWEKLLDESSQVLSSAQVKTGKAEEKSGLYVKMVSDTQGEAKPSYFSEDAKEEVEDFYKKVNALIKEELKNAPVPGGGYDNDAYRRDTMEMLFHFTEAALNGSLEEELTLTDDYLVGNSLGGFIPATEDYGVGLKPKSDPYVSDYARFEHLVPVHAPTVNAMRLVTGNLEYQKKAGKASKSEEIELRERMIVQGAEALYAVDKMRKNMVNEKVIASFPVETKGAHDDSIGDRGRLHVFEGLNKARRQLVVNGWAMPDITALGRLASLISANDKRRAIMKRNYEKYINERFPEYQRKLDLYEERERQGLKPNFKPVEPKKPAQDYSEPELRALEQFRLKIDEAVNTAPGNEQKRKEIINSLINEIDALPDDLKKSMIPLKGIREDLRRAAEHVLTGAEKEIMADPSSLKQFADAHPVREYTADEQAKDLEWLANIEEKDKELNNIFKTDPYAHDKIREMQALSASDPGLFTEAVKKAIGEDKWNSYAALPGREKDELKAIDILTHPDSPHNVSKNHKILKDMEDSIRLRVIDIPKKNLSTIGTHEMKSLVSHLFNAIPSIAPGYDIITKSAEVSEEIKNGTAFNRQKEYIERLNKVLSDPGELTALQQREEIGRCMAGILTPIGTEAYNSQNINKLFSKDNLSEEEKKTMENAYFLPFNAKKGGLMSASYAEKIKPIMSLMDKALKRAETLMKQDGHEVSAINLRPVQKMVNNALNGTSAMKIHSMDPVIHTPEANLYPPMALEIDRQKEPIKEGSTKDFTFSEIEEKKDIFPLHKAFNAEYELQKIWGEYLTERQKGPVSAEKETQYWERINEQYGTLNSVLSGLVKEHEKDPDFAKKNMRCLVGMNSIEDSFDDVVAGNRGMHVKMRFIRGRQVAFSNGWPLSDLGFYSHFEEMGRKIDSNIADLEAAGGAETQRYINDLKEFSTFLKDNMLEQPYEKDPEKRAEIYRGIADRVHSLNAEKERLLDQKGISKDLKTLISNSFDGDDVFYTDKEGCLPFEYEARIHQKEAEIEAVKNAKEHIDEIKDIADPIVYYELKNLVNAHPESPVQDFTIIDTAFVEKADIYLNSGMGSLAKEIEAVKQGKETTLAAKTGLTHEKSVNALYDMLNASDSFFHFDSDQYKAVKQGLNKMRNGTATPEDKQKLTEDVKTWLTDPKYDRINKHSKNEFDNTRFNIMFTLANELDPDWAKEKFPDMNIAALHGEKAANTSFHNVHEYTNFMHRQMADGGFLTEARAVGGQHWYLKADSYGQKGLVEEVLRIRADSAISETDKLKAELDNLNKLTGDVENMSADKAFKAKFSILNAYRQDLKAIVSDVYLDDNRRDHMKEQLGATRANAIDQIKTYLNDTANRSDPLYDKAALAYGVLDPKGAHEFIIELNNRKIKTLPELENVMGAAMGSSDIKIKPINLAELEKQQGIDLGGHRTLAKKKAEIKRTQKQNEHQNQPQQPQRR